MDVRGSLATALVVAAMGGCAATAGQGGPLEEAPAEDQPLDLTVDSLDIVHGALRLSATMVDGAADVSVRLGGDCEHRDVGGGVSTLSALVWSLGDEEVAEAIGCGLSVRARVRGDARPVNKIAELDVAIGVSPEETESTDDGLPQLQTVVASTAGVAMVFSSLTRGSRLTTADSILAPAPLESQESQDPAAASDAGRFIVPRIDFVRSVLGERPIHLDGTSFWTSLSVGGTAIQADVPVIEPPQPEDVDEEATDETPDQG
jgi:hypothetical protein